MHWLVSPESGHTFRRLRVPINSTAQRALSENRGWSVSLSDLIWSMLRTVLKASYLDDLVETSAGLRCKPP